MALSAPTLSFPKQSEETNSALILVGGPDSRPTTQWAILSLHWQKIIYNTKSRVRVLAHEYKSAFTEAFSWSSFPEKGNALLESVYAKLKDEKSPYTLSFICHGLGGFILKQALCIANAQPARYASLLSSIVGIMFLGVPHAAPSPDALAERATLLLRSAQVTLPKQFWSRLEKESDSLWAITKLFEDIKLRVTILSIFEKKETKVKGINFGAKGLFASSRKLKLVDEEIATTNSINEQLLGLAREHADLCELHDPNSNPHPEIVKWVNFIFGEKCRLNVEAKLEILQGPASPVPSITSISTYDAARKALTSEPERSNVLSTQNLSIEPTAGSSGVQGWDVVPLVDSFTPLRRVAKLPCFVVENLVPNRNFYARQSILEQLDRSLLPSQDLGFSSEPQEQRHAVLCGLGGLGKTSIAVEFTFSRRNHFDAVFWIRADELSKLDQGFCKIATSLGLEDDSEPQNPVISRGLAKGWLENPRKALSEEPGLVGQNDANWLLVFDNADKPDVLQDYWPISSNGSILVTSRDPRSKLVPSVITNDIQVPLLEDEESASMLRSLSRVNKEPEISLEIAKKLGGLPLAIAQMAAIIQHQYMSFTEFLERYTDDEDRQELHALEAGGPHQNARGNLSTIWLVEQLEPFPRTLLEMCAVLDPDCIQERILLKGVAKEPILEAFPTSMNAYVAARAELIKRSLVSRNEEKRELWVHRILQDSVVSKMSDARIQDIFSAALSFVSDAWGPVDLTKRHDIVLSKARAGLYPHTLSLKTIYEKHVFLRDRETSLQLGALMNEAGWWQHERGNSHDIKTLLTLAEEICVQFPGEKATELLCDVHYGLAAVANETNDKGACLRHTQQLLEMRLKIYDESEVPDLRLAIAHNEYAIALVMNGDFEGAVTAFTHSIDVFRSLADYWPGMDTNPRTNLGFVLWNLGKVEEAYDMFYTLLVDREARFGVMDKESFRTGRILKGLGNVTYSQGRLAESEEYDKKALAQWQGSIGNNHHKTADGCIGVAKHCIRRQDFENARKLLDQALMIYRLRPDVYKPQIARTVFLYARLTMFSGSETNATELFKEARDLRNEIAWATKKADSELRENDFEELIILWSR